ncbi:uncharacterized protein BDV14DRAFT_202697 [Aspergillus stella-maris]|uniref:uncharacterized protein n=1 Tax=Aspergillus stella-maris TaxID=1810926 RepID=UPI003CCD1850
MENLNDDILLLVGDYLEILEDRYNAILVNRRFNKLFPRSLYRSARLSSRSQVQSFLKAILLRPSLSGVVRSLDFTTWQNEKNNNILSADDVALFSQCAKTHSATAEEHIQWERNLVAGVDEAWTALLLSTVHNVSKLNLVYPNSLESKGYLDRLFDRATTTQQQKPSSRRLAFHRLREVSLQQAVGEDDVKGTFSTAQVMPFLSMPKLQKLSVDSLVEYCPPADERRDADENERAVDELTRETPEVQGPRQQEPEIQSPSLTEINLTTSNGYTGLSQLLSSCPSLTTFKYQHSDAHLLSSGFQPSAFFNTLSTQKSTLQTIHLDNLGEHLPFTIQGLNESYDQPFDSLADFKALKDLRIRLPNLLDMQWQLEFEPSVPLSEVLPTSIETLFIESCKENTLPILLRQIQSVLDAREKGKKKFGALQSLDIEGVFHDDEEDEPISGDGNGSNGEGGRVIRPRNYELVEPLRDACEKASVQFHLRDRACAMTML